MENTAFTGDDEPTKEIPLNDDRENGKGPGQVGIAIDKHLKATKPQALAPYAGMNKEDLLRFSDTPFWNRLRLVSLAIFWLIWIGLIAAIVTLTIVLPRCKTPPSQVWWQKSTFYQVYVRSFQDSDADGSGDLKGLESRLSYLEDLGVEGLVLSSVLDSGTQSGADVDVGYQVVDYTNIDQLFGNLGDMDDLITEAHNRGLRVVMDFVPNYTGLDHPWFIASASATDASDPYWNYYIWNDCASGAQFPNNWRSVYDGDAWIYNATRDQCYLAQFLPGQPELNLNSPAVQAELEAVLRFWLARGVDGFRVNNVAYLYENPDLWDEDFLTAECDPATESDLYRCYSHENTRDRPEIHDVINRWKSVLNEYSSSGTERVLITDANTNLTETLKYFTQFGAIGSDLPLYYQLRDYTDRNGQEMLDEVILPWISGASGLGTTNWMLDSQDISRVNSTLAVPLSVLSLTLPGVPMLYYGQELGMVDGVANGVDPAEDFGTSFSRDPYRSPMQWNDQDFAGFTNDTSSPYLPVNPAYTETNVETLLAEDGSVLNVMRSLIALKRDSTALQYGDVHFNAAGTPPEIVTFVREYDGTDRYLVIVNLSGSEVTGNYGVTYGSDFEVPEEATMTFNSAGSTGSEVSTSGLVLDPYQAVILSWEFTR